jgi:hypothetical protein
LLLIILLNLALAANFLLVQGYLPPPFIYDTTDDFMDWFNSAYWANNPGSFDVWGAIYPPISFVFLKVFSIKACYAIGPEYGRDCDWLGHITLWGFFIVNAVIVFACYRRNDRGTAAIRTTAVTLGLPMLFAVDRGNLIIPCFTCFALGHGKILRSARLKWLAVALSINFKPYLLAALASQLLRRRWRWLEGCALACVAVYLITYALWGSGSPGEIIENQIVYARGEAKGLFEAVFYGTSFSSLMSYLTFGPAIMAYVGSKPLELISFWLPILMRLGQLGVVAAFAGVALSKAPTPVNRLAALGVSLALTSTEVGGYAEVFLIFLVFFEPWRGPAPVVAILCAYTLCIPADLPLAHVAHQIKYSYLTHRTVGYDLGVNLGILVRPALLLGIQYALVAATMGDVWRALRLRSPVADAPRLRPELGIA